MKKTVGLVFLSILLFVLVNTAYSSDDKGRPDYSGHFGDMDTDGDDQVNWKEFKLYFPHAQEKVFKEADHNADGFIDHDEWHEFKEAQGYSHEQKG